MSPYYFQNVSTSKGSRCSQITVEVLQTATEGKSQHFVRILKAIPDTIPDNFYAGTKTVQDMASVHT